MTAATSSAPMKNRALSRLLLTVCLCAEGCSPRAPDAGVETVSPPPAPPAGPDAPGAAASAGSLASALPTVGPAAAAPAPAIDWSGAAAFVAQNPAAGALAVPPLYGFLSAFVREGQTLDVTRSAVVNAAAIASELASQSCAAGTVTYKGGTAYIVVDFGMGCLLTGARRAVTGTLLVGVTTTPGRVLVRFDLEDVAIEGYTVDGYALMSNDGVNERFDTRLTLTGLGIIAFQGTGKSDGVSIVVDGKGTWDGAVFSATSPASGGSCASAPRSALLFHSLQRTGADCFPGSGSLDVVTPYTCTGEANEPAELTTLLSTSSVPFVSATPTTASVAVSVKLSGAAADSAAVTTALPVQLCGP